MSALPVNKSEHEDAEKGFMEVTYNVAVEANNLPTACCLCSHNCGLKVDIKGNKIVEIRADESNPFSHGYSCNKAYAIDKYVSHKQRVTQPMKRLPDGSFENISWDQAIAEIGGKLKNILAKNAPRSVAYMASGQGNHLGIPYSLAMLWGMGSPSYYNALAQEKTQHALTNEWMFKASPNCWYHGDDEESDYLILLGSNTLLSNRGRNATELIKDYKKDEQRKLVVVDPRKTETARRADTFLPIKVGTDAYLMLAMATHLVQNKWVDQTFIQQHTKDYDKIAAVLEALDTDDLAGRCELSAADIKQVTYDFAHAKRPSLYMDLGVEQSLYSTLTAYLYRLIPALTGQFGAGRMVFEPLFAPTDLPPEKPPTKALVSGMEAIPMYASLGIFSYNILPEEVMTHHPDRVRALIVQGANPVIQGADSKAWRQAMERLELSVVIEPALSETARLADYVLPAPVGYEKWEFSAFPKMYPDIFTQVRPPVINSPKQALPEAEIINRLAKASGIAPKTPKILHRFAKNTKTPTGALIYLSALLTLAAIKGRSLKANSKTQGYALFWSYETLGSHLAAPELSYIWLNTLLFALTRRQEVLATYPNQSGLGRIGLGLFLFKQIMDHPEGVVLGKVDPENDLNSVIQFSDKKIRLAPWQMLDEIERALQSNRQCPDEYPLVLQGGMRTQWNANVIIRDPSWRKGRGPHEALWVSETDAENLSLSKGQLVLLETMTGQAKVPIKIDKSVQVGHVHLPNGFGLKYPDKETGELKADGVSINELTDAQERDPFTGSPYHKYIPCRISATNAG